MKKIIFLLLFSSQANSFTVVNERIWCSGEARCGGHVTVTPSSHLQVDVSKTDAIVKDQQGYQGIEINLGGTHTFYIYNATGSDTPHILRAKLCDAKNNCFNYEKTIVVRWKEVYTEIVYSSVLIFRNIIGAETIFAESEIDLYPSDFKQRKATLLVSPFPYD